MVCDHDHKGKLKMLVEFLFSFFNIVVNMMKLLVVLLLKYVSA